MGIRTVRRMAADILKCGESKVRIDPARISNASSALTRDDVKMLIMQGVVSAVRKRGVSRARGRKNDELRRKGRKGSGRKRGPLGARINLKDRWMSHVRAQRSYLRQVRQALKEGVYRSLYLKVKGGEFKSRAQLANYIKDNGLMK
ncbi:MAG: 50S ribosomal protein L19e [Candidatus Micrarchaeota archaeon]|nr:50S ribosomal protein L19e [Candidatus Micrarchaeota archaeon]